ncbi:hypothetical protein BB560_006210, partial [Smittium megazygosporum]
TESLKNDKAIDRYNKAIGISDISKHGIQLQDSTRQASLYYPLEAEKSSNSFFESKNLKSSPQSHIEMLKKVSQIPQDNNSPFSGLGNGKSAKALDFFEDKASTDRHLTQKLTTEQNVSKIKKSSVLMDSRKGKVVDLIDLNSSPEIGNMDSSAEFPDAEASSFDFSQNRDFNMKIKHEHLFYTPKSKNSSYRNEIMGPQKGKTRHSDPVFKAKELRSGLTKESSRSTTREFKYASVERRKSDRKHMCAYGCENCEKFFEHIGPLRSVENTPTLFKTRKRAAFDESKIGNESRDSQSDDYKGSFSSNFESKKPNVSENGHADSKFKDEIGTDQHMQAVGRHREIFIRPRTPNSYWDVDFPSDE